MHILVAVDTFPENHETFVKWMRQRALQYPPVYSDPSLNMKPREIRIYDIVCPKSLEKEVISDIKYFERSKLLKTKTLLKLVRFLTKNKFPLEPIDEDIKAKTRSEIGSLIVDGKRWFAHASILGKIKDDIHPEGKYEMV